MKALSLPALSLFALFALSVPATLLAGCGGSSRYDDMSGEAIYMRLCASCHGEDGRARTGVANSYVGKRALWTEATLLEYLDNPAAYKPKAPHLTSRYMPPLSRSVPPEARRRLVEHVLAQMEALEGND